MFLDFLGTISKFLDFLGTISMFLGKIVYIIFALHANRAD